jgi:hydrogenase expression/formation protein HypC
MCVGVPLLLTKVDGILGLGMNGTVSEAVDLSLLPEARPGDWVLGFLGTAHSLLSEHEALKIRVALNGLQSLMMGGDLGDAFADLESREPSLPPHLQTALAAGQTKG